MSRFLLCDYVGGLLFVDSVVLVVITQCVVDVCFWLNRCLKLMMVCGCFVC